MTGHVAKLNESDPWNTGADTERGRHLRALGPLSGVTTRSMVPELLPISTPSRAHLRLAGAHIIDWRDQRGRTLDLRQHDVVLDGGRAPPPIELDDLVKLRPFAKDCRPPFETVALAQQAINDIDLQDRVMAEVCDGAG